MDMSWDDTPAEHVNPHAPRRRRPASWARAWAAIIGLAVVLGGLAAVLLVTNANAGIGAGGYAQIARTALQKAGHPFGYNVTCTGAVSNYATDQVTVRCIMREP